MITRQGKRSPQLLLAALQADIAAGRARLAEAAGGEPPATALAGILARSVMTSVTAGEVFYRLPPAASPTSPS